MYMCVYIYIYIERERDIVVWLYMYAGHRSKTVLGTARAATRAERCRLVVECIVMFIRWHES